MRHCLPLVAGAGGLTIAVTLACSSAVGPSGTPADGQRGVSTTTPEKVAGAPTLTPQTSGTTNRLQAVSPVNQNVVWASGVGGTFVLTTDGGETWRAGQVPGAETLEFRDVEGVSAKRPTCCHPAPAPTPESTRLPMVARRGPCSSRIRSPMRSMTASTSGRRTAVSPSAIR